MAAETALAVEPGRKKICLSCRSKRPLTPIFPTGLRSRLRQANDAARSDDTSGAATSIRTAESVMLDGVKQQPNNARSWLITMAKCCCRSHRSKKR